MTPLCQHCQRRAATGIWEICFRAKPEVTKVRLLCADCGMDSFPSRHGVLWIALRHSLGQSSHLHGPECTSTLVPQAEGVKIEGRFFITCKCAKCNYSTQYELSEIAVRVVNNTHINLLHPSNVKRIKVTQAASPEVSQSPSGSDHLSPPAHDEELPLADG